MNSFPTPALSQISKILASVLFLDLNAKHGLCEVRRPECEGSAVAWLSVAVVL